MADSQTRTPQRIDFTSTQLEQIAERLVNDRNTHRLLDRKFAELHISEPSPEPSPEEQRYKKMGLQPGVDYYVRGPSKRQRLLHAVQTMYRSGGGHGVLQLIRTLHDPISYVGHVGEFRAFCEDINRILRFSGVEYKDDGKFHRVVETRNLSEAERRARP